MKHLLITVLMYSSVTMAKVPLCHTEAGSKLTLANSDITITNKEDRKKYWSMRETLAEECEDLEKSGVDAPEIAATIYARCNALISLKNITNDEYAKFIKLCDLGKSVSDVYIAGVQNGRNEVKKCEDKTTINDLSRSTKTVEQEISNSAQKNKTTGK